MLNEESPYRKECAVILRVGEKMLIYLAIESVQNQQKKMSVKLQKEAKLLQSSSIPKKLQDSTVSNSKKRKQADQSMSKKRQHN